MAAEKSHSLTAFLLAMSIPISNTYSSMVIPTELRAPECCLLQVRTIAPANLVRTEDIATKQSTHTLVDVQLASTVTIAKQVGLNLIF